MIFFSIIIAILWAFVTIHTIITTDKPKQETTPVSKPSPALQNLHLLRRGHTGFS
jgi:hypothetical protein